MTSHGIEGKVAFIAGGAKNLGGLLARDLAAHGARAVAIHYNSDASRKDAEATVAAVTASGAQAVAFQADLTSAAAMAQFFADAVAAVGRPDIAINTVGKVLKKPIVEITEAEYDEMSGVNAKSAFFFLKECGLHLNDNGRIVTLVTSLLGAYTPFYASYAGTKAPVEHFHPRGLQGVRRTGDFGQCHRAGADGHALLLPGGGRGCGGLSPAGGGAVALLHNGADRYRGYRAVDPHDGVRRLVDDGSDHPGQRWLHNQVRFSRGEGSYRGLGP